MEGEKVDLTGSIDASAEINTIKKKNLCPSIMAVQLSNANARELFHKAQESIQPWSTFLAISKFKVPKTFAPVGKRIVSNVHRFQGNYMFIFLGLFIFCVLTSPLLLIAIATSLGACYIISLKNTEGTLKIAGRELSLVQQYSAVGMLSFPLFWIAGAGSAVFWIIGASFFVIMVHAGLYSIDEEVAELDMIDVQMETV